MILRTLFDIVLPPVCPLCSGAVVTGSFCAACTLVFEGSRIKGPVCRWCGEPFASVDSGAHTCGRCLKEPPPFRQAKSAYFYEDAVLGAVASLKYNYAVNLVSGLGSVLSDAAQFEAGSDVVMPVPLYIRRLRQRGFNQSLLLAREVARALKLPVDYVTLVRVRDTPTQTGLKAAERRLNVKGAFAVVSPEKIKDRRVLLVDDVMTTGSTVRECASVLSSAGAIVNVLTLARAVRL